MAISSIGNSTGTYVPYMSTKPVGDKTDYKVTDTGKIFHQIDLNAQKVDPYVYIKWCRTNLGTRGETWEFWMAGGMLYIEIWGDKAKFTYEMWKH